MGYRGEQQLELRAVDAAISRSAFKRSGGQCRAATGAVFSTKSGGRDGRGARVAANGEH